MSTSHEERGRLARGFNGTVMKFKSPWFSEYKSPSESLPDEANKLLQGYASAEEFTAAFIDLVGEDSIIRSSKKIYICGAASIMLKSRDSNQR